MKTLGTTIEGNYLVEMSADEHYSFARLEASVNGSGYSVLNNYRAIQGANLAPVFKALDYLFETKISISRVKEYVDFLSRVFGEIEIKDA